MRLLRKFITNQFLLDQKRGRIALILPTSDFTTMRLRWLYPDAEEVVALNAGNARDHKKLVRVERYKPLNLGSYQQLPAESPVRVVKIVRTLDNTDILLEALLIPPDFLEPSDAFLKQGIPDILKLKACEQVDVSKKNIGNLQKILVRVWR